jgi:hypothetical protein
MDDFQASLEKSRDAWARFNRVADDVRDLYPDIVWVAQDYREHFKRLGDYVFFLYCQDKTGLKAHLKAPGFPYLAAALMPSEAPDDRKPWSHYPVEAKNQIEEAAVSSYQHNQRPVACSWSPGSGGTERKPLFRFHNPYLKEIREAQEKQPRLAHFDFETVVDQLLSFENEKRILALQAADNGLPVVLLAMLADLEQVTKRMEHGDRELVPTVGHYHAIVERIKAMDNTLAIKVGEMAGTWADRVETARKQAEASQTKQKERRKIVARFVEAAAGDRRKCVADLLDAGMVCEDMQCRPPYGRKKWRPEGIPEHPLATSLATIERDIKAIEGPKPVGRPRKG